MTHIWVPSAKIIEPKRAISVPVYIEGWWKLEAIRPDGRRRLLADWFRNLITDAGLNNIGTNGAWLNACQVGTGTNLPANGDTALQTFLVGTTNQTQVTNTAQGSAPYYGSTTNTYRFDQGDAAGNLTEIGITTADVGGVLFSRARILDGSSNPTSITVLADEFLDATYQIRIMPPLVDSTPTINISGTDYDLVVRAANVTNVSWAPGGGFGSGSTGGVYTASARSGAIGAITTLPSGSTAAADSTTLAAYGNNNLYREATATWGLTAANFGGSGILAVTWLLGTTTGSGGMGMMQAGFTPGIPKTSADILTLVLRHTWARGTP
jgi:hypothetical protein